jgi:hypothetical protein
MFDTRYILWFGIKHAQKGGRVHCPCTDLGAVRLGDQASGRPPEVWEVEEE